MNDTLHSVKPWRIISKEALERGLSLDDLPDDIRNLIITYDHRITPERAKVLAEFFGTSVEMWMELQRAWDEENSNNRPR